MSEAAKHLGASFAAAAKRLSKATGFAPDEILPVLRGLWHRDIGEGAWDEIALACARYSATRGVSLGAAADAILPVLRANQH